MTVTVHLPSKYRHRNWRTLILPAVAVTIGCGGCIAVVILDIIMTIDGPTPKLAAKLVVLSRALYDLTIIVCGYVTGLTCWKLLRMRRQLI